MDNIKRRLNSLLLFIDILKIIEIVVVITFGFYQLYLKYSILLTAYKILYIVLIILILCIIILINDCLNALLRGFFIIVDNCYESREERKKREQGLLKEKVEKAKKTKQPSKKSTKKENGPSKS